MSAITIIASADHGGGGHSQPIDVGSFHTLRLTLDVTSANPDAFGGTQLGSCSSVHPTLSVSVEASDDGEAWQPVHQFSDVIAATAEQRVTLKQFHQFVRCSWHARAMAAGVSPCFVWSLAGEAV